MNGNNNITVNSSTVLWKLAYDVLKGAMNSGIVDEDYPYRFWGIVMA